MYNIICPKRNKQAFCGLTDKKLYILHIATHGAYRVQKGCNVELHPCFC